MFNGNKNFVADQDIQAIVEKAAGLEDPYYELTIREVHLLFKEKSISDVASILKLPGWKFNERIMRQFLDMPKDLLLKESQGVYKYLKQLSIDEAQDFFGDRYEEPFVIPCFFGDRTLAQVYDVVSRVNTCDRAETVLNANPEYIRKLFQTVTRNSDSLLVNLFYIFKKLLPDSENIKDDLDKTVKQILGRKNLSFDSVSEKNAANKINIQILIEVGFSEEDANSIIDRSKFLERKFEFVTLFHEQLFGSPCQLNSAQLTEILIKGNWKSLETILDICDKLNEKLTRSDIVKIATSFQGEKTLRTVINLWDDLIHQGTSAEQIILLAKMSRGWKALKQKHKLTSTVVSIPTLNIEGDSLLQEFINDNYAMLSNKLRNEQITYIATKIKSRLIFTAIIDFYDRLIEKGFSSENIIQLAIKNGGPRILRVIFFFHDILIEKGCNHEEMVSIAFVPCEKAGDTIKILLNRAGKKNYVFQTEANLVNTSSTSESSDTVSNTTNDANLLIAHEIDNSDDVFFDAQNTDLESVLRISVRNNDGDEVEIEEVESLEIENGTQVTNNLLDAQDKTVTPVVEPVIQPELISNKRAREDSDAGRTIFLNGQHMFMGSSQLPVLPSIFVGLQPFVLHFFNTQPMIFNAPIASTVEQRDGSAEMDAIEALVDIATNTSRSSSITSDAEIQLDIQEVDFMNPASVSQQEQLSKRRACQDDIVEVETEKTESLKIATKIQALVNTGVSQELAQFLTYYRERVFIADYEVVPTDMARITFNDNLESLETILDIWDKLATTVTHSEALTIVAESHGNGWKNLRTLLYYWEKLESDSKKFISIAKSSDGWQRIEDQMKVTPSQDNYENFFMNQGFTEEQKKSIRRITSFSCYNASAYEYTMEFFCRYYYDLINFYELTPENVIRIACKPFGWKTLQALIDFSDRLLAKGFNNQQIFQLADQECGGWHFLRAVYFFYDELKPIYNHEQIVEIAINASVHVAEALQIAIVVASKSSRKKMAYEQSSDFNNYSAFYSGAESNQKKSTVEATPILIRHLSLRNLWELAQKTQSHDQLAQMLGFHKVKPLTDHLLCYKNKNNNSLTYPALKLLSERSVNEWIDCRGETKLTREQKIRKDTALKGLLSKLEPSIINTP